MALDNVDHRLAAILSADVVGYSRLMALDEAATVRTLTAYREQLAVLIRQYRGRVVDFPGDNVLAEFPSAFDAVRCAVEIQRVLQARNADQAPDRKMEFRIGIHLGDVMVEGDRIYGDGVNIAARLEGLAEAGGVRISGTVYEQVRNKLSVRCDDLGEQPIKHIPDPVRVYRIRWEPENATAQDTVSGVAAVTGVSARPGMAVLVVPAVWVLYVAIVFEILFMISPFAFYYYSAYGPSLNALHRSPWTAWITQFFLPHFSQTSSRVLNRLEDAGRLFMTAGAAVFLLAFMQIYWAKVRRRGLVTGGLYAMARHPQYLGLAIVGLGTLLVWPRFLILITYVTMLFLYRLMARWEEEQCAHEFSAYRAYRERTGMLGLRRLFGTRPRDLARSGGPRVAAALSIYALAIAAAVALGFQLRDYSLSCVSSSYTQNMAVLSPAVLTNEELSTALRAAMADGHVQEELAAAGRTAKLLVYVVPVEWRLPDLPLEMPRGAGGGHYVPRDFDRRLYKILFTRARLYDQTASGREIVKRAYGLDPIVLTKVSTETGQVTAVEAPPAHVRWGDIPTPLF